MPDTGIPTCPCLCCALGRVAHEHAALEAAGQTPEVGLTITMRATGIGATALSQALLIRSALEGSPEAGAAELVRIGAEVVIKAHRAMTGAKVRQAQCLN